MHQTPNVVSWKVPSPPVSPTPITGFHLRVKNSGGTVVKELTTTVVDSASLDDTNLSLRDLAGQPLTVTVASVSAADGESPETSSSPFTVVLTTDAPDAPTVVQVG